MVEKLAPSPLLEACVEKLEQAMLAEQCGAGRIELCANLEVGGLTPSRETIAAVKEKMKIPVRAIIRPRAGGFVYNENEIVEMEQAILFCKKTGLDGVVLGCLQTDRTVDIEKTRRLVNLASPMQVTFHKAIDETPNLLESLLILMGIKGVSAILTSGGEKTALEGKMVLRQMIKLAGNRLKIIAAGSITTKNLEKVQAEIGANEYHGRRIVF
ncbi:MAG: copper homeostasis protein CutC [Lewinellaceae bacterium]|nr:copper homeostasis protein CutC [Saprospiraceae bacterium]MCB9340839.1 copper homeostasis protein CutC [Lewinellaceae bacterium]